jgi:hypothetical protein
MKNNANINKVPYYDLLVETSVVLGTGMNENISTLLAIFIINPSF